MLPCKALAEIFMYFPKRKTHWRGIEFFLNALLFVEDIFHFKMCFPDTLKIPAGAFHILIGTWLLRMVHPSFSPKIKYESCSWKRVLPVVTWNLVGTGRNQEQPRYQ
jgi:hypothetical protein